MNLFVTFRSADDRDTFVSELRQEWPELLQRGYVPKRRAEIILEHLDEADRKRLELLLGDRGRVHEDVQFEPFRPSR